MAADSIYNAISGRWTHQRRWCHVPSTQCHRMGRSWWHKLHLGLPKLPTELHRSSIPNWWRATLHQPPGCVWQERAEKMLSEQQEIIRHELHHTSKVWPLTESVSPVSASGLLALSRKGRDLAFGKRCGARLEEEGGWTRTLCLSSIKI